MDKILHWFSSLQHTRYSVRLMRILEKQDQNKNYHKGDPCMSRMRKSMVRLLDDIGAASGCHQMPERSSFYKGYQFPVCARCTGVFVGQLSAIIYGFFWKISPCISVVLLGVMGIDWGVQEIGIKESTNLRRFLTGICGGFGLFSIYIYAFKKIRRLIL